jgi:hypothetical protein
MSVTSRIKNFFGITPTTIGITSTRPDNKHDLNRHIVRMKLDRIKQDIALWREAISQAENVYYPNRLALQRLYLDTVLNGHVRACMRERKDLTLLKDFEFQSPNGEVNKKITDLMHASWFYGLMEFIIDAQFYGYSLINWTEVEKSIIKDIQIIKRWNISPDRLQVLSFPGAFNGTSIFDPADVDWSLWVPTPSEDGISNCGWGLLRSVAPYEIYLRNLMGFNGDYVETFAQPFRHGKTDKTNGPERDEFEKSVANMGAMAYAITDPLDDIEFKDTTGGGNGYKSYESFQERNEKTISKLFFGHSDAIDSRTGKLGSEQGEDSPVAKAIRRTEARDARFVETVINDSLIEKLNNLGFGIPAGTKFVLLNNKEKHEAQEAETAQNQAVATVVKTLNDSGYETTPEWITKQTNIPITKKPEPKPATGFNPAIKNKLEEVYGKL